MGMSQCYVVHTRMRFEQLDSIVTLNTNDFTKCHILRECVAPEGLSIYRHYLIESYIGTVTKDCLISYTYVIIRNVKFIVRVAQIRTHFIEHIRDVCKDDEFT